MCFFALCSLQAGSVVQLRGAGSLATLLRQLRDHNRTISFHELIQRIPLFNIAVSAGSRDLVHHTFRRFIRLHLHAHFPDCKPITSKKIANLQVTSLACGVH